MVASRLLLYSAVLLALVASACGGDDGALPDVDSPEGSGDEQDQPGGNDGTSNTQADNSGGGQNGFVTIDGTTYAFTYDNLGRCGAEGDDGSVVSFGSLIDDPNRQVTFTYGLPEETTDGTPIMQVIVMAEDGTQLYYSAVGFGSTATGSVDTITKDGDTVRITGQLQHVPDQTLVDFEAEATCEQ